MMIMLQAITKPYKAHTGCTVYYFVTLMIFYIIIDCLVD